MRDANPNLNIAKVYHVLPTLDNITFPSPNKPVLMHNKVI